MMGVVMAGRHVRGPAAVAWLSVSVFAAGASAAQLQAVASPAAGVDGAFPPRRSQSYQVAMGRYEGEFMTQPGGRLLPVPLIPPAQSFAWTWTNDSGRVQRVAPNLFRLSGNDCLSHFCRQISCMEIAWPVFQCSDDRQRRMSAPDAGTVIFGGVAYRRIKEVP